MRSPIPIFILGIVCLVFFDSCKKEEIDGRYKVYDEYGGGDRSSLLTSGNELIVTGMGMHNSSLLILKTDLQGNLIWKKYYDVVEHNGSARGTDIHETHDGNILIGAIYYTTGKRYCILKVNNAGDTLWSYHFKNDVPNFMYEFTAVTPEGDFVAVGETYHKNIETEYDLTLMKISKEGEFLFSRSYPYDCRWNIDDARSLANGNLLFSGYCNDVKSFAKEIDDSLKIVREYVFDTIDVTHVFITSPEEVAWSHADALSTSFTVTCSDLQSTIRWQNDFEIPSTYITVEPQRIQSIPEGYLMSVYQVNKDWYPSHTGDPGLLFLDKDGREQWRWSETEYFKFCYVFGVHYTPGGYCTIVGDGRATNEDNGIFIWQLKID